MKHIITLLALCVLFGDTSFAAEEKRLKVFVLAGQSNVQGHAKVSTFEHMGMDPATKPMLADMPGPDDKPGGYDAYSTASAHFIRGVRHDFNAPNLPFVIGVLGVDGPTSEYGPDEQRYNATHQSFRDAMAAPAQMPEFKGNVAAVLAEKYWDRELKAARKKEAEIKQRAKKQVKEAGLKPAEAKSAQEKLLAEGLTERGRLVLAKGISNLEFHYLGSAKILGGIGKELAEAMVPMIKAREVR